MSRDEIEAKFRGNAALAVSEERATRIIGLVAGLAALPRLTPLMQSLTR